jgi:hypothetical protein
MKLKLESNRVILLFLSYYLSKNYSNSSYISKSNLLKKIMIQVTLIK